MRRFFVCGACSLALFVLGDAVYAKGDTKSEAKKTSGQRVKEAIEKNNRLPEPVANIVRDDSALDLKKPFGERKYRMTYSWVGKFQKGPVEFSARSSEWNVEKGAHDKQIRLTLVVGDGPADARNKLFEVMAMGTTRMITPATFGTVKDGPGDVCITMPERGTKEYKQGILLHGIWFVRDNIGVHLACSGNTDLLPIAKAVDKAIRACPKKGTKGKAGK
jgi:hypothetical protein